jgi:hypothetical protein
MWRHMGCVAERMCYEKPIMRALYCKQPHDCQTSHCWSVKVLPVSRDYGARETAWSVYRGCSCTYTVNNVVTLAALCSLSNEKAEQTTGEVRVRRTLRLV